MQSSFGIMIEDVSKSQSKLLYDLIAGNDHCAGRQKLSKQMHRSRKRRNSSRSFFEFGNLQIHMRRMNRSARFVKDPALLDFALVENLLMRQILRCVDWGGSSGLQDAGLAHEMVIAILAPKSIHCGDDRGYVSSAKCVASHPV